MQMGAPACLRGHCEMHLPVAPGASLLCLRLMQLIPPQMLPVRDKAALEEFLVACRDTAREKGRFQVASISLAVKHIAPLAVLQSIYEPGELHFYVERGSEDAALAGAEAVVGACFEGADRFERVKAFAEDVLANTIAFGDLEAPFAGPHFFTAFGFGEAPSSENGFAPASVFLPRWQVSRSGGRYGAVANIRVEPEAPIAPLVEKLWAAYVKFSAFDYTADRNRDAVPFTGGRAAATRKEVSDGSFREGVGKALAAIGAGQYEKIVLARAVDLERSEDWRPLVALDRLRARYAGCFTFSFGGGAGTSFIGASPERLLRVRKGQLETEAIAGSAPRGSGATEDARLARDLLSSGKDLHEHACVRDSILRRLRRLGIEGQAETVPRLLQLANVQHLHTPIRATVGTDLHLLDLAAELHPTPAVGGTPRGAAVPQIRALEGFDRGLYAGLVGWFNHLNDGEMIVGIRSALIEGHRARLYAGAGIVAGSDIDTETMETEMKLQALMGALTGEGEPD